MATSYNFLESLSRIEECRNNSIMDDVLTSIPDFNETHERNIMKAWGSVVYIKHIDVYNLKRYSDADDYYLLQAILAFASEVCRIFRSNASCRDIIVADDRIIAVYNTSFKEEMNELINDLARIRTLSYVVEKKFKLSYKSLSVKIAACYGRLDMSVVENRSSYKQYVWTGEAKKKAEELIEKGEEDKIFINRLVWKNLTEENQKLFKLIGVLDEDYEGKIVNIAMNNWLNSK